LNVSLEHEQGYPVIKAKHPKIGFLVTSFKWHNGKYNILIAPLY
jgi:hypothetical protein